MPFASNFVCFTAKYLMHKFKEWLNNSPGMATKLGKRLKVGAATISNVKHERTPMPTRWIPHIVTLSRGLFSYQELVDAKVKGSA